MKPTTQYRADIDGLRAIAVLSVVFYHYGASWLPGGFTGVDIFFVISGYLITSIISKDIRSETFSLLRFYERRVRRIIPAMVATVLVSIIAGYFLLWPGDLEILGWSSASAMAGVANVYFWRNTGYFDQAAGLMPLLHLWSLAVEEQFYLIWPTLLLFLNRRQMLGRHALAAIVAVGFAVSVIQLGRDPKGAFYLPFSRAWELALGGLIVFLPPLSETHTRAVRALGALMVAGTLLLLSDAKPFPGWNALPVCLGTALLIWPSAKPTASAAYLGMLSPIGLISYSLYLWHWPVLVFFRHYQDGVRPDAAQSVLLIALSLMLAFLSWRFVERPFRTATAPRAVVFGFGFSSILLTSALGAMLVSTGGFPRRVSPEARTLANLKVMWDWSCPAQVELDGVKLCNFGDAWQSSQTKVLLWGDSHAEHLLPILNAQSVSSVSYVLHRGCAPFVGRSVFHDSYGDPNYPKFCKTDLEQVLATLAAHPEIDTVMMIGSWDSRIVEAYGLNARPNDKAGRIKLFYTGISEIVGSITALKRRVVLLTDTPGLPAGVSPGCTVATSLIRTPCAASQSGLSSEEHHRRRDQENMVLRRVAAENKNVSVLPLDEPLCAGNNCLVTVNGEFIYRDTGHFRRNLSAVTNRSLYELLGFRSVIGGTAID